MKPPAISEKEFMAQVVQYAKLRKWLVYHTHDSRHSAKGFPDLVFVRDTEILFVEMKSDKGKLTPEQEVWVDALVAAGQQVAVWRPSYWNAIQESLE
jgi:hypothetical protein